MWMYKYTDTYMYMYMCVYIYTHMVSAKGSYVLTLQPLYMFLTELHVDPCRNLCRRLQPWHSVDQAILAVLL